MLQDRGKRGKIFFQMEQPGDGAGMEKLTDNAKKADDQKRQIRAI